MQALAWYNNFYEIGQHYINIAVQYLRRMLGPEPQRYYLLANGEIVPATTDIPESFMESALEYNPESQRITQMGTPEGRYRPIQILSLVIRNPIIGDIDISEWIGELRMLPVFPIQPSSLVRIWASHHSRYIPIQNTLLEITDNEGTQKIESMV